MKLFGKCKIKSNGSLFDSRPGASIDMGGVKRTPLNTDNSQGFTEESVNALIECEMVIKQGDSIEAYRFTDATVVFECDTGQRFIVKDAYTTDPPKVTGGQGVRLQIAGLPAQEMVS